MVSVPTTGATPLGQLLAEYMTGRRLRAELAPRSAAVTYSRLRPLIDLHGDFPAASLDRRTCLRFQERIGRHAPATRRHAMSGLHGFCAWLVLEGHLETDPSAGLARVKEPRTVPRALSAEDVVKVLLAAPDARMRAMVWLMVECGLRCVEVAGLELGDWDRHAGTLQVTGKGGHERVLPISGPAADALGAYVGPRRGAGPLFRSVARGRHYVVQALTSERVSELVAELMVYAGVHVRGDRKSAHSLRHTAASDVLDACHDVRLVQNMLGHASLATTQRYLRIADLGQLREAMSGRDYLAPRRQKTPGAAPG